MSRSARWHVGFACAGTAAFMGLYSRPWHEPVMIAYDLAAAPLVFAFVGGVLHDLVYDRMSRALAVRLGMLVPITVVPVLRAANVVDISGHLTCALAVGSYVATRQGNRLLVRLAAAAGPLAVLGIRLVEQGWPPELDTELGLVCGGVIGIVGAYLSKPPGSASCSAPVVRGHGKLGASRDGRVPPRDAGPRRAPGLFPPARTTHRTLRGQRDRWGGSGQDGPFHRRQPDVSRPAVRPDLRVSRGTGGQAIESCDT